jgi:hypothetical protein
MTTVISVSPTLMVRSGDTVVELELLAGDTVTAALVQSSSEDTVEL